MAVVVRLFLMKVQNGTAQCAGAAVVLQSQKARELFPHCRAEHEIII